MATNPIDLYWHLKEVFKDNANINISMCNGDGQVFDQEGNQIQNLPEVEDAIQAYLLSLPEPQPIVYDVPIQAPDFIVASPKPKDDPKEALLRALEIARRPHGEPKSVAEITLNLVNIIEDLEKRIINLEDRLKKKGL